MTSRRDTARATRVVAATAGVLMVAVIVIWLTGLGEPELPETYHEADFSVVGLH